MSLDLDATYWNSRYQNNETGWDTAGITTPLKEYFDQLNDPGCSILIPGAGNAYEAEYLFKNGFRNVSVCDIASAPLEKLKKRCPDFPPSHFLLQDFFLLQNNRYDLIIEQTFFCALDPSLRKKYFEKMHSLLKPGGRLVGLLFDDPLNTDKPPFGGNTKEYRTYFSGLFKIRKFETSYNSIKPREGRELFINLEKIN